MIEKKICLLGSFAVGKTSLIARFVAGIFSEKYLTTIGVKIDRKTVQVGGEEVGLLLWDIYGEDEFQKLQLSYLRGAAGYVLVIDGTRRVTFDKALQLQQGVEAHYGPLPFVIVLNKSDLAGDWELDEAAVEGLAGRGWTVIKGSAKTGLGVEEAFHLLAGRMMQQ
jgi:small GTP-binding protein